MKKVWELPPGAAMLGVGSSAGPPFGYRSGQAFSKSARKGAPQLFRFMFKDKLGVYFPVKVAPPLTFLKALYKINAKSSWLTSKR